MSLTIPFQYLNKGYADANKTGENFAAVLAYINALSPASGTVNIGTANRLAYYPASTAAVSALAAITASKVLVSDANGLPTASSVTSTTLAFLDATSSVQTQLNGKANTTLSNLTDTVAINKKLNDFSAGTVTADNLSDLGYLDMKGISNPSAPAAGTARFHALTTQGFTRFEQDNEAATNITIGRDSVFIAKNTSGSPMTKGQVVHVTGATGTVPNIGLAKADSLTTLPAIGILLDDMASNAFGQVMKTGILANFDTSGYSAGDTLWVSTSTAGGLQKTRPASPNFVQRIGTVGTSNSTIGNIVIVTAPFIGGQESSTNSDFTLAAGKKVTLTGGTTGTVGIIAPASVTSYTLTLPANDGGVNEFLQTDGSGTTTWAAPSGSGTVNSGTAGQFAYYATTTDAVSGQTVLTVSGTTLTASNVVLQPAQPSFLVTDGTGAADVTGDATVYTEAWPTEIYDQASNFASNTFTAPVTGRYFFSGSVFLTGLTSSTNGAGVITLVTSNRNYLGTRFITPFTTSGSNIKLLIATYADMDANDTATVTVSIGGTSKVVDVHNDATFNYWGGSLIN